MVHADLGKETRYKIYKVIKLLDIQESEINAILQSICDFILNNKKLMYYLGSSAQETLANKVFAYLRDYWEHGYNPNIQKTILELGMAHDLYRFNKALMWLEHMGIITIEPDEKCSTVKRILKADTCRDGTF